LLRAQLRKLF
jgi:hypothetical protein